jgi:ligand-binding sensor domain-containing protein
MVFLSCNQRKEAIRFGSFTPNRAEVRFDTVPADSIFAPVSILVNESKLKKISAGKPQIKSFENNIQSAKTPKVIAAGKPRIITPGTDTFLYPVRIDVVESPVVAGMPETFVAKDMSFKVSNPYSFSSFGKLQGLKHGIVTCLLQDKSGNLWICSAAGVTRYDGRSFSNFTVKQGLAFNDVRSVLQDRWGNIWFGTLGGGVSKFDGISFTNFTMKDGLCNNFVVSMTEDDSGNIWFATWDGVTKFDGKTFTSFSQKQGLINNFVRSVVKDRWGNVWFGTKGGTSKYDNKSFINFTYAEGLCENDVYSLLADIDGNIWFGTAKGVSIYNGSSFTHITSVEGLINNEVYAMYEDRFGDFWLGTHYGISRYNGKTFTSYTEKQGLSNDNIYCFLEDRSGNLWIGTSGGGVSKYTLNSFTHITETEGLQKSYMFSIYEDRSENLWFGTWRGGVSMFNGNSLQHFTEEQGLPDNDVRSICQDKKGNFWFATYKGVAKYDGKIFTHFNTKTGLINDDVHSITEDKKGNLWFATAYGVSKYDGNSFTNFSQQQGFVNGLVNDVKEDKSGNLWFSATDGVYKYDDHSFKKMTDNEGMLNTFVYSILEDKSGSFWIGTERGLFKYDGKFLIGFTEREGLINNSVMSTLEDKSGNLWFGSRFGLSKLSPEKSALLTQRIKSGVLSEQDVFFKNYSHIDNFLGIGCYKGAILQAKNNKVWIGTNAGVTVFNPEGSIKDTIAPTIQITAVKIENENQDWIKLNQNIDTSLLLSHGVLFSDFRFQNVSQWYNLPQQLSLAYNNNSISFDFIGITMNQPQNVKYQYKLEGLDKSEGKITTRTSASYGNLGEGNYIFKVKAMNSDGVWSKEFKYTFTIRRPWWRTWWFRILAIALLSAVIFFISRFVYHYQLRKQRVALEKQLAVQYERQRISADLHDDIGSTLSSINIYAGLAKKEADNDFYLDSIHQNVNEVVSKLDDLVWSINPRYDTLGSIAERLYVYAEPAATTKEIVFNILIDDNVKEMRPSAEIKHHLYMVLKELINNAIKHAGCKNISTQFTYESKELMVVVNDDGKGFDRNMIRKDRNGLGNMQQRVTDMNGRMVIESNSGFGTKMTIRIPA